MIQFINNILYQRPIKLMDGGKQKRCFTFIGDGVSALVKMIENENGAASGRIFNIGNPNNNLSIADAAQEVISVMKEYEKYAHFAEKAKVETAASATHFGAAYEDVKERIPLLKMQKIPRLTPTKNV
ncbi:MAG: NAD-dependent epimerase/dehydratase family protein [Holosporaceae bacterium]|nr:MAG: NAD-dependent epimerase/dehydratase family protein [Holosporaceae bacterium]